jgi:thioredoxin-like negative regulator of GroEL
MPGVLRELAEHRIDVNEGSKPIRQRLRRFSPDKKKAFKKEIIKLMAANFIREILHPDWLANPVLVQKSTHQNGACVSITRILTNIAQRTRLGYRELIKLSI